MRLSKSSSALGVALLLNIAVAVLLSPIGFESRPPSTLTAVGMVAIGTVFLGIVLDVIAIVLLFRRRVRAASALAIAGSLAQLRRLKRRLRFSPQSA